MLKINEHLILRMPPEIFGMTLIMLVVIIWFFWPKKKVRYKHPVVDDDDEYLVDLCLLEFEECDHPKAHFDAIDDGEHVEILK